MLEFDASQNTSVMCIERCDGQSIELNNLSCCSLEILSGERDDDRCDSRAGTFENVSLSSILVLSLCVNFLEKPTYINLREDLLLLPLVHKLGLFTFTLSVADAFLSKCPKTCI